LSKSGVISTIGPLGMRCSVCRALEILNLGEIRYILINRTKRAVFLLVLLDLICAGAALCWICSVLELLCVGSALCWICSLDLL
jgi:hypothetical protein